MLNFFIGFAFFEAGAFFGFFVATLMQAARSDEMEGYETVPYLGVWSQRNRRFSAGKFYAFRAALWRG